MSEARLSTGTLDWADTATSGRGLILLHSLGTDRRMWNGQMQAFASLRRVLAVDLPGHGKSNATPGEYRLDDLGADVLAVADRTGLDHFDVCGVSLGGLIGLWLAINAPERVSSLVASNTAARIGSRQGWSERMAAVASQGMMGLRDQIVPRWVAAGFPERDPETYSSLQEMFASVDPAGYVGCCAALRDADLRDAIGAIDCPTLVIGGEHDTSTPPSDAHWLHGHIAGSRLEVIPDAAHLANVDRPDVFTALVAAALEQGGPPGHR